MNMTQSGGEPGKKIGDGTWDVSRGGGRTIIFSDVPTDVSVSCFDEFSADYLFSQGKNGFIQLVSILGDFRFVDQDGAPVTQFQGKPVTLHVSITEAEAAAFKQYRKKYLVQFVPGEGAQWKPLKCHSLKIIDDQVLDYHYAEITFSAWGIDPPSGWGVGS
jgi:hypothetical protein